MIRANLIKVEKIQRRRDRNILTGIFLIGLLGYITDSDAELLPLVLFGLGLLVFYLERVYIGKSLSFSAMTIPSVFLFGYITVLCLGAVVLWSTIESNAKNLYLYALLVVLVTFPIGVMVANLVTHNVFDKYHGEGQRINASNIEQSFELYFWLFIIFSVVVLVFFFIFSAHIQLIDLLLQREEVDPTVVRFAQAELPKVIQYFFEVVRRALLPICMLYAYFMKCLHGGKWRKIFPIIFVVSFFVSLLTLDRSPPMGLLAMLMVAYLMVHKDSNAVRWLLVVAMIVVVFILSGIISIFQYQSASIAIDQIFETAWYVATYRIFISPLDMAISVFESYNYDTHFLYGEYVRFLSFLPGHSYADSLSFLVEEQATLPATFVGDLWRNWGWIGLVVGAFSYGFIFQYIQAVVFSKISVARAPFYVVSLLGSLAIIHGNALGIMVTSVILLSGILGRFALSLEKKKRRRSLVISQQFT